MPKCLNASLKVDSPPVLGRMQGGVQQQLQAATPLALTLLKSLNASASEASFKKRVLSEEDAVVQWDTPAVSAFL